MDNRDNSEEMQTLQAIIDSRTVTEDEKRQALETLLVYAKDGEEWTAHEIAHFTAIVKAKRVEDLEKSPDWTLPKPPRSADDFELRSFVGEYLKPPYTGCCSVGFSGECELCKSKKGLQHEYLKSVISKLGDDWNERHPEGVRDPYYRS